MDFVVPAPIETQVLVIRLKILGLWSTRSHGWSFETRLQKPTSARSTTMHLYPAW